MPNKLERDAGKRRKSGLIDVTQERFAIEGRKPLADHVADFVSAPGSAAEYPQAREHDAAAYRGGCRTMQGRASVADLTGADVLRVIDEIRQAGDMRVKDATDERQASAV